MFSSRTQTLSRSIPTLAGQVLGLLAFSMIFTAAGAFATPLIGPRAATVGSMGALVTFAVLFFAKSLAPVLRLAIFYLFSAFQGITLAVVLRSYVAAGLGNVVVLAAGTTAGLVFVLAVYAWTTQRNIASWGGYLFIGLIGVLIASVVGIFVRAPLFHLAVSAATAVVFSGYLLFHIQQLKSASGDAIGLAIGIYLDILNLFWALLRILSELQRRTR